MIFVNGNILRAVGNPNTGLFGTVQTDTRLTIAADGEIFIRSLTNNAPPFFPLTNQYAAPRFPRMNPDPLYDRPLWEELTAQ